MIFLNFYKILFFYVGWKSWGHSYIPLLSAIITNRFICGEIKFNKTSQIFKILWKWLPEQFSFAFYLLLTAEFVIKSHIQLRVYVVFLMNILKEIWMYFNARFKPQSKDWKDSYQVRIILALFWRLISLSLG